METNNIAKSKDELQSQESPNLGDNNGSVGRQVSATPAWVTAPPSNGSTLGKFTSLTRGDARERLDEPPALPFDLRHHKLSVTIFTILVVAECSFVPLALYYGLKYGTTMRSGKLDRVDQ